jgi:methionyl-tRNA formyltransferase
MTRSLRIIFMGTPEFAATALRALLDTPHHVVAVYTQPPRPKGRGQQVAKSPVHALAEEKNLPVFTPKNFKGADDIAVFEQMKADVAVVAAYGLILPQEILDAPRHGCINIHASLLPRWRGAAPIQYAILSGDKESGITIMQMNKGLDTGPMIIADSVPITARTTTPELHDSLAEMGGRLIVKTLAILAEKSTLCHTPQNNAVSTYAPMLKKEDGAIDWNNTAEDIDRQVRALNPWPGTYCILPSGMRMKILSAEPAPGQGGSPPGTILDKDGRVACGGPSALRLLTLQPDNKKPMECAAAFNGGYIKEGFVLK